MVSGARGKGTGAGWLSRHDVTLSVAWGEGMWLTWHDVTLSGAWGEGMWLSRHDVTLSGAWGEGVWLSRHDVLLSVTRGAGAGRKMAEVVWLPSGVKLVSHMKAASIFLSQVTMVRRPEYSTAQ
ncbi:hypothetical protein ACOMHN_051537 [Nucella lapillus]